MTAYNLYLEIRIRGQEESEGKVCGNLRELIQTVHQVAAKFGIEKPAGAEIKRSLSDTGEYLFSARGRFDVFAWKTDGVNLRQEISSRVAVMRERILDCQPITEDDFASPALGR